MNSINKYNDENESHESELVLFEIKDDKDYKPININKKKSRSIGRFSKWGFHQIIYGKQVRWINPIKNDDFTYVLLLEDEHNGELYRIKTEEINSETELNKKHFIGNLEIKQLGFVFTLEQNIKEDNLNILKKKHSRCTIDEITPTTIILTSNDTSILHSTRDSFSDYLDDNELKYISINPTINGVLYQTNYLKISDSSSSEISLSTWNAKWGSYISLLFSINDGNEIELNGIVTYANNPYEILVKDEMNNKIWIVLDFETEPVTIHKIEFKVEFNKTHIFSKELTNYTLNNITFEEPLLTPSEHLKKMNNKGFIVKLNIDNDINNTESVELVACHINSETFEITPSNSKYKKIIIPSFPFSIFNQITQKDIFIALQFSSIYKSPLARKEINVSENENVLNIDSLNINDSLSKWTSDWFVDELINKYCVVINISSINNSLTLNDICSIIELEYKTFIKKNKIVLNCKKNVIEIYSNNEIARDINSLFMGQNVNIMLFSLSAYINDVENKKKSLQHHIINIYQKWKYEKEIDNKTWTSYNRLIPVIDDDENLISPVILPHVKIGNKNKYFIDEQNPSSPNIQNILYWRQAIKSVNLDKKILEYFDDPYGKTPIEWFNVEDVDITYHPTQEYFLQLKKHFTINSTNNDCNLFTQSTHYVRNCKNVLNNYDLWKGNPVKQKSTGIYGTFLENYSNKTCTIVANNKEIKVDRDDLELVKNISEHLFTNKSFYKKYNLENENISIPKYKTIIPSDERLLPKSSSDENNNVSGYDPTSSPISIFLYGSDEKKIIQEKKKKLEKTIGLDDVEKLSVNGCISYPIFKKKHSCYEITSNNCEIIIDIYEQKDDKLNTINLKVQQGIYYSLNVLLNMIIKLLEPYKISIEKTVHHISLKSLKWFRLKKGLSYFGFLTDYPHKLLNTNYYIIKSSGTVELENIDNIKNYQNPDVQIYFNFKTVSAEEMHYNTEGNQFGYIIKPCTEELKPYENASNFAYQTVNGRDGLTKFISQWNSKQNKFEWNLVFSSTDNIESKTIEVLFVSELQIDEIVSPEEKYLNLIDDIQTILNKDLETLYIYYTLSNSIKESNVFRNYVENTFIYKNIQCNPRIGNCLLSNFIQNCSVPTTNNYTGIMPQSYNTINNYLSYFNTSFSNIQDIDVRFNLITIMNSSHLYFESFIKNVRSTIFSERTQNEYHSKVEFFFKEMSPKCRNQLQINDEEALYSITADFIARKMTNILLKLPHVDKKQSSIIDCCACIGGNSISFALHGFSNVVAIEKDLKRYKMLQHNSQIINKEYSNIPKIKCNHDDCLNIINNKTNTIYNTHDIIFFDPPWGGKNNLLSLEEIQFGKINFLDILNTTITKIFSIKPRLKYIALKLDPRVNLIKLYQNVINIEKEFKQNSSISRIHKFNFKQMNFIIIDCRTQKKRDSYPLKKSTDNYWKNTNNIVENINNDIVNSISKERKSKLYNENVERNIFYYKIDTLLKTKQGREYVKNKYNSSNKFRSQFTNCKNFCFNRLLYTLKNIKDNDLTCFEWNDLYELKNTEQISGHRFRICCNENCQSEVSPIKDELLVDYDAIGMSGTHSEVKDTEDQNELAIKNDYNVKKIKAFINNLGDFEIYSEQFLNLVLTHKYDPIRKYFNIHVMTENYTLRSLIILLSNKNKIITNKLDNDIYINIQNICQWCIRAYEKHRIISEKIDEKIIEKSNPELRCVLYLVNCLLKQKQEDNYIEGVPTINSFRPHITYDFNNIQNSLLKNIYKNINDSEKLSSKEDHQDEICSSPFRQIKVELPNYKSFKRHLVNEDSLNTNTIVNNRCVPTYISFYNNNNLENSYSYKIINNIPKYNLNPINEINKHYLIVSKDDIGNLDSLALTNSSLPDYNERRKINNILRTHQYIKNKLSYPVEWLRLYYPNLFNYKNNSSKLYEEELSIIECLLGINSPNVNIHSLISCNPNKELRDILFLNKQYNIQEMQKEFKQHFERNTKQIKNKDYNYYSMAKFNLFSKKSE